MVNFFLPSDANAVRVSLARSAGSNAYDGVGTPYTIDNFSISKLEVSATRTTTICEDVEEDGQIVLGGYRYGFNGQEMSNEIKGTGNSYTAEFWEYDPRIGRRWNTDPVVKDDESPYMTFGNSPIVMIDLNGADWYKHNKTGKAKWFDGSGTHKRYTRVGGEDHVFDGGSMDEVVVTATARKKGLNYGLQTLPRWQTQARRTELYTNFQKLNSGGEC